MTRWRVIVTQRTTDVSSLLQCALHAIQNAIMRYMPIAFKMAFIMYIAAIISNANGPNTQTQQCYNGYSSRARR